MNWEFVARHNTLCFSFKFLTQFTCIFHFLRSRQIHDFISCVTYNVRKHNSESTSSTLVNEIYVRVCVATGYMESKEKKRPINPTKRRIHSEYSKVKEKTFLCLQFLSYTKFEVFFFTPWFRLLRSDFTNHVFIVCKDLDFLVFLPVHISKVV